MGTADARRRFFGACSGRWNSGFPCRRPVAAGSPFSPSLSRTRSGDREVRSLAVIALSRARWRPASRLRQFPHSMRWSSGDELDGCTIEAGDLRLMG